MAFIKNYYPILLESLLFVCFLSLFEYVMYYIILAPDNKVIIQDKVDDDIKKALDINVDLKYPDKIKEELEKHPLMAQLALNFINNKKKIDLKNTGYRYYLQQLDDSMANENQTRRYGVTILIFILFLLMIIFALYGRFIIKVPFSPMAILTSISITFVFIAFMQLYFVYKVTPQFKMINNKSIEKAMYGFMLGKPLELPK
jgi:hypothetical protein